MKYLQLGIVLLTCISSCHLYSDVTQSLSILNTELHTIAKTIKAPSKNQGRPLPLTPAEKIRKERESAESAVLQSNQTTQQSTATSRQQAQKPRNVDLQRQAGQLRKTPIKTAEEKAKELKKKRQEDSPLLEAIEQGTQLRKAPDPEKARAEKIKHEKEQEKEKATAVGVSKSKLESAFNQMAQRMNEQKLVQEGQIEPESASEVDWDDDWED